MFSKLFSLRHKVGRLLIVVVFIALFAGVLALIAFGYSFSWTGFSRKTLWDWLQLLIIPVVLAVGGFWLSQIQKRNEQRVTDDNQQETALQAYIDKMSELLNEGLGQSKPGDKVRQIARARTLTVLSRLDANRKRSVLQFLYESGLISKGTSIVEMSGANLRGANLRWAYLKDADLRGALLTWGVDLREAHLEGADLRGAFLNLADLKGAWLEGSQLEGATLICANLRGAKVTQEQLKTAKSLQGATMPGRPIRASDDFFTRLQ